MRLILRFVCALNLLPEMFVHRASLLRQTARFAAGVISFNCVFALNALLLRVLSVKIRIAAICAEVQRGAAATAASHQHRPLSIEAQAIATKTAADNFNFRKSSLSRSTGARVCLRRALCCDSFLPDVAQRSDSRFTRAHARFWNFGAIQR